MFMADATKKKAGRNIAKGMDLTMTRSELLERAKPILFNTEMVRAIQDGTKTVERLEYRNESVLSIHKRQS